MIGELLGVPEADRDQLREWFDDILHRDEDSAGPSERAMAAGVSIGRMVTAAEIGDVVAFLASPRSVAINGDAIAAGGGARGAIHY